MIKRPGLVFNEIVANYLQTSYKLIKKLLENVLRTPYNLLMNLLMNFL
jgi:hypothetical protein